MNLKEELEQKYREDLEAMYKDRDELERCLETNQKNRNEAITKLNKQENEQKERLQKLYDDLNEDGKNVLKLREGFELILQSRKYYAFLISALYAIIMAGTFYFLNLGFSTIAIISYIVSAILIIPIYIISLKCLQKPWNHMRFATYSDANIIEYDKKIEEERKIKIDNTNALIHSLSECDAREKEMYKLLNEMKKREEGILLYLDELDFHIAYNKTILFYGENRGNYYDIYIDGDLYDTVRGKTIVTIKLPNGSHYIKFTNTALNFDKSVIYSFSFKTEQLEINDSVIMAYPVVIDMNSITYPNVKRFQEITKQKLI